MGQAHLLLLFLAMFCFSFSGSQLWAKRANELIAQKHPGKAGYEQSKLAAREIPETPSSFVHAGTLNETLQEEFRYSPGVLEFQRKYGSRWNVLVDERTMAPKMLMGEGIPFSVRSASAQKAGLAEQGILAIDDSVEALEKVARQFLTDNQTFLKVDPNALQLDPSVSGLLESATGKYRLVFKNTYQKIPVLDSYVSMIISHGNLILYGAEHLTDIHISIKPVLSRQGAVEMLRRSLSLSESDVLLDHAANLAITLVESSESKVARSKAASSENLPTAYFLGPAGQGYTAKLVYRIEFHVPNDIRSLVALVDANTGEIVDLFDQNFYQRQTGKVRGAIYTRGPVSTPGQVNNGGTQAPEYLVPFDRFTVNNSGTTMNTDPGGVFKFGGLPPSGYLGSFSGFQSSVTEVGATPCPSPRGMADSLGNIIFSSHFDDGKCSVSPGSPTPGNGLATHAARNGWFHTNFAISHAQKFLMGFSPSLDSYFNSPFNVLVNDDGCPAFWSNQCSTGQECMDLGACGGSSGENNQATEPDTMSHEYGHALDFHTKPTGVTGDPGKGEGLADVDAWLNTHRTCLSPGDGFPPTPVGGFGTRGFPAGDACNSAGFPVEPLSLQQTGVRDFGVFICHDTGSGACSSGTVGRLESNDSATACGSPGGRCKGSLGYECHCEGHTTSGSVIDLFKALVTRYSTNQAWYMIERLYYLGLANITSAYGSAGAGSLYTNFLAIDDDDGNLSNGTPNADLIYQAFRAHGTEGTQVPRFRANCTTSPGGDSPASPSGFSATPQTNGILLQWNAVPGASGYRLYRTAASQPRHNYENDSIPSSYYGKNGVFFALINPATRVGGNPNSGNNFFPANGVGTQSYLDVEVAPGYEYFYQIQAVVPFGGQQSCLSSLSPNSLDLVANATVPVNVSVPNGGAVTSTTVGSTGFVQAGSAVVTVNSGNPPYGTAVFSFTQNGIVLSEAGVPTSPPTTAARIFIDYRTNVPAKTERFNAGTININTGFAVVNRGVSTANITYTLRTFNGTVSRIGHGTLGIGAHRSKFINQLSDIAPDFELPPDFPTATKFGSLDITSDQPLSVLALRLTSNQRGDTLITSTPIADLTKPPGSGPIYFAHLVDGGGYKTVIVLLNTSNTTQTGTLQIFKDDGTALIVHNVVSGPPSGSSTFQYKIDPAGFYRFETDGSPQNVNTGWVQLIPDNTNSAPIGAGIFNFTQNGTLVTESGIPSTVPTTHARIFVDESGGHDTGLALADPSGTPMSISLNAFQSDGATPIGSSSGPVVLNGNGHTARFVSQLISGLPNGFTGVLDITSSSPFVALTLRSLTNTRGDFLLTTFPIADVNMPAPAPIVFPQVADGGGFRTQIILLGANGASSVSLSYFGDDGQPITIASKKGD